MPWADGSPPVPIVVRVAVGSSGRDPVTLPSSGAGSVAHGTAQERPCARRALEVGGPDALPGDQDDERRGRDHRRRSRPRSARPCARRDGPSEPGDRLERGRDRVEPHAIGHRAPRVTPPPRNAIGHAIVGAASPLLGGPAGHATPHAGRRTSVATGVDAVDGEAITSGERPSRNPADDRLAAATRAAEQNGTAARASVPPASQLFPTQNTRSTTAGAPTSASTTSKVESRRPIGTAPRYRVALTAPRAASTRHRLSTTGSVVVPGRRSCSLCRHVPTPSRRAHRVLAALVGATLARPRTDAEAQSSRARPRERRVLAAARPAPAHLARLAPRSRRPAQLRARRSRTSSARGCRTSVPGTTSSTCRCSGTARASCGPTGEVDRPVTVAGIAPTAAELLKFDGFRAPDGQPMTEALLPEAERDVPKLLVTMVWDAGGINVLEEHPTPGRSRSR